MIALIRLLIREHIRKLNRHNDWISYSSAGLMLLIFGWLSAATAMLYIQPASVLQISALGLMGWVSWTIAATMTGKDGSWQINLERIRIFPSPGFLKLYALTFLLGFLSFPLFAGFCIVQYLAVLREGFSLAGALAVSLACLFLAASVRLSASIGRTAIYQIRYLTSSRKAAAILSTLLVAACTFVSIYKPGSGFLHPGCLFGAILSGDQHFYPLIGMALWTVGLLLIDSILQYEMVFSGIRGPQASVNSREFPVLLRLLPIQPSPLFRIGISGWFRSRNTWMLFAFGSAYSFLWTYITKPGDALYFFLFIFMNLLFHSYLRGNLLGIDRSGVWLYYRFPIRIERALSSKSLSLSFLQGCMIASLLAAGLASGASILITDWGRILCYAVSGILFGEILGLYFSVRYPDPIDRTSQYDGGLTAGAIALSILQFLWMVLFLLASGYAQQFLPPAAYWGLMVGIPLFLVMIRFAFLKTWVHQAMLENGETLIKELSGN